MGVDNKRETECDGTSQESVQGSDAESRAGHSGKENSMSKRNENRGHINRKRSEMGKRRQKWTYRPSSGDHLNRTGERTMTKH